MNKKIEKYLKQETWYHGTTLADWHNICLKGIKADHNKGNELDFGYGFYLMPNRDKAVSYIVDLLKYNKDITASEIPLISYNDKEIPVVIEFSFCPMMWYESNNFNFKFLNAYDDEFARFVFHNRVYNINGESQHNYDIIFGVMSDNRPTLLVQKYKGGHITEEEVIEALKKSTSIKQLSLHNQKLCDIIKPSKATLINTGEELNINDYLAGNRGR